MKTSLEVAREILDRKATTLEEIHRIISANYEHADLAESCMAMIKEALDSWGCCHEAGAHESTPPMFYPELLACIIRHHSGECECKKDDTQKSQRTSS